MTLFDLVELETRFNCSFSTHQLLSATAPISSCWKSAAAGLETSSLIPSRYKHVCNILVHQFNVEISAAAPQPVAQPSHQYLAGKTKNLRKKVIMRKRGLISQFCRSRGAQHCFKLKKKLVSGHYNYIRK